MGKKRNIVVPDIITSTPPTTIDSDSDPAVAIVGSFLKQQKRNYPGSVLE